MNFKILYPNFKPKCVTLSFDDGTFYDIMFVEFLNKHGLKCSFNINSGLYGQLDQFNYNDMIIYHNRLAKKQYQQIYKGHEVAAHSISHPSLVNQNKDYLDAQVLEDIKNLQEIAEHKVDGFALPGGTHDAYLDDYLKDKVLYSRTIENSHSYAVPETFVPLHPTTFILEPKFSDICTAYISAKFDHLNWLYIWGHSYEFSIPGVWENVEKQLLALSKQDDIYFATNRDVIHYVQAARKLKYVNGKFINNSPFNIYIEAEDKQIMIPPNNV